VSEDTLAAVERIVAHGGEADDVLRGVVEALVADKEIGWAGIAFVEGTALVLGPAAGTADEERRARAEIAYDGSPVGELQVDGAAPGALLERVADLVAPYVLVGWDIQGATWEP